MSASTRLKPALRLFKSTLKIDCLRSHIPDIAAVFVARFQSIGYLSKLSDCSALKLSLERHYRTIRQFTRAHNKKSIMPCVNFITKTFNKYQAIFTSREPYFPHRRQDSRRNMPEERKTVEWLRSAC